MFSWRLCAFWIFLCSSLLISSVSPVLSSSLSTPVPASQPNKSSFISTQPATAAKQLTQSVSNASQLLPSTFLNGSLPAHLQNNTPAIPSLMSYQSTTKIKSFFGYTHSVSSASPTNVSLTPSIQPLTYGLSFSQFGSALAIHNSTLLGAGTTGSSTYSLTSNPSFGLNLVSQGSGGTMWSNFTIGSFTGKRVLNPSQTDLVFNTSFRFLSMHIPQDGIRYSFYIDFKFNVNKSLVSYAFPAIVRFHLLYSPYYANYTLFSLPGNPALKFYLASDSSIDLVLDQSMVNQTQSLSINFSDLFNQVATDYNETSFLPYFSTFRTVEIGFFSTNSTLQRSASLLFNSFNLYNNLKPANWLLLHVSSQSSTGSNSITVPVSSSPLQLTNVSTYSFSIFLKSTTLLDPALFGSNNFLITTLTTSYIRSLSFHISSVSQDTLLWSFSETNFPLQLIDSFVLSPATLAQSQSLFWYVPSNWLNASLPTRANTIGLFTGPSIESQAARSLATYQWFGGSLANDFFLTNFTVLFQSSNAYPPCSIRGFALDDLFNVSCTFPANSFLPSDLSLFHNTSSGLVFLQRVTGPAAALNFFSFTLPVQSFTSTDAVFTLFSISSSPQVNILVQSFSVQTLLASYNNTITCSNQVSPFTYSSDSFFSFALNCSFYSSSLSPRYFDQVFISVSSFNQTFLFHFSSISSVNQSASFSTTIFVPYGVLLSTTNLSVASHLTYVSSSGPQVKWQNFTYISFNQFNENLLPQQSDLYRYVPFYIFFSVIVFVLILYRKKRVSKALQDQVS